MNILTKLFQSPLVLCQVQQLLNYSSTEWNIYYPDITYSFLSAIDSLLCMTIYPSGDHVQMYFDNDFLKSKIDEFYLQSIKEATTGVQVLDTIIVSYLGPTHGAF